MYITKTDYLEYTFCRKNLWLKKYKPEIFENLKLSDFEKKIIEEGNIADKEARHLFPEGKLIDSQGRYAITETNKYIRNKEGVIFQATFFEDDFYIRADILVYNSKVKAYELYEVKASNDIKRKNPNNYINDLAFQKNVIEKSGIEIYKSGVIHLNRNYRKQGRIDYNKLFVITNISDEIKEAQEKVQQEMKDIKRYLNMPEEKSCECLYRGRSKQCTSFKYSNPEVPDYSIHDINRIGSNKKLLYDLADKRIFKLEDIDRPDKLTGAKKAQYEAYMSKKPIIDSDAIAKILSKLKFPLQFFDYEGFISAIPVFDNFGPYEQVPFQYSLHIMQEDGSIRHKEFIITETKGDTTFSLVKQMKKDIDPSKSTIVWHMDYEKNRNKKLAKLHPEYKDFLEEMNDNIFDLKTIFSNNYYVDHRFKGSASIKNVLPILIPELNYNSLNIRKGDQASERWEKMIHQDTNKEEKEKIKEDLLEYCKLDTWAMVRIYKYLIEIIK
jgi:hypothetical protein